MNLECTNLGLCWFQPDSVLTWCLKINKFIAKSDYNRGCNVHVNVLTDGIMLSFLLMIPLHWWGRPVWLNKCTVKERTEDTSVTVSVLKKPFCTPVLSAIPCTASPPIKWDDPMNVQQSPMRPLIWTLNWWWWWCFPVNRDRCAHVEILFSAVFSLNQSSFLQYYSITQHVIWQHVFVLLLVLVILVTNTTAGSVCLCYGRWSPQSVPGPSVKFLSCEKAI